MSAATMDPPKVETPKPTVKAAKAESINETFERFLAALSASPDAILLRLTNGGTPRDVEALPGVAKNGQKTVELRFTIKL